MSVVIEEEVLVEQDELSEEVKRRLQPLFSGETDGPEVGKPATCEYMVNKGTHMEPCGKDYDRVCGDCHKFICKWHTHYVGSFLRFLCPICFNEYGLLAYKRGKERLG